MVYAFIPSTLGSRGRQISGNSRTSRLHNLCLEKQFLKKSSALNIVVEWLNESLLSVEASLLKTLPLYYDIDRWGLWEAIKS